MADEEETDETSEETPSADDIAKMQAALKKANDEAKKYRLDVKAKDDELAKMKAAQDSSKSEMDKVREQIDALSERAEKAEREALVTKVAQAKKLPGALASRLTGSTQEELEEDADTLIAELGLGSSDEDGDNEDDPQQGTSSGRPKEKLRPGASNDDDQEPDYKAIAEKVLNKNKI